MGMKKATLFVLMAAMILSMLAACTAADTGSAPADASGGDSAAPPAAGTGDGEFDATGLMELPQAEQVCYNLSEYESLTGATLAFSQSPILDAEVEGGALPAIGERLPAEPVVMVPYAEVGEYGGSLTLPAVEPKSWWPASQGTTEYFFTRDMRYPNVLLPSMATGYTFSDDFKSLTLSLREGLKWSDGAPFSADDILFWWDVVNNEDITPTIPPQWMPGGEPMTVAKEDDHTVRFDFAVPSSTIIYYFCQWANYGMQSQGFLPKHVLENYLPENNPNIEQEAKAAGFDSWSRYFMDLQEFTRDTPQKLEIPYMGPWVPAEITNDYVTWKRNPYYFKVDTAGNQLPYIDTYKGIFYKDADNLKLRTLAGDFDYVPFGLALSDQTVLSESADAADFHIIQTPGVYGADCGIFVNATYEINEDEGAILADKRFRQALSVAIDREEMNIVIAQGFGSVTQATIDPGSQWFKQEYADAFAQYDVELANQLLDEMGMDKRGSDGFRLMPNGEPFTLVPEFTQTPAAVANGAELVKDYWEKVGIRTNMKIIEYAQMAPRLEAGEVMIMGYPLDGVDAITTRLEPFNMGGFRPSWNMPAWYNWVRTGGATGTEPSDPVVKEFLEKAFDKGSLSDEDFDKLAEEMLTWEAENVYTIGTFGYVPAPTVVRNGLGNVDAVNVYGFSHPADGTKSHRPEVFFWKDASKRS
uniref:Putative ATPbinding peptide transport protein n=1 Tax=termite gut metagenome TaxID=433724 RepID=S0DEU5_9ZZZZ